MPRHGSLADQLGAYRAYKSRPEVLEPVQTNWSVVPAGDSSPDEIAEFAFERKRLVTPSVRQIMRNVAEGPQTKNAQGQIVAIGSLRFSDGTQTERAYTDGPDGSLVQFDARMPTGAMLGTRDKPDVQAGGSGATQADVRRSNLYFAEVFGVEPPRFITAGKRRNGPSLTADQSRAVLADAVANTSVLPAVTYCPPALPCGSPRVAENFNGMRKGKKGESGSVMWQDIVTSKVQAEIWDEALAEMAEHHRKTLDAASMARTMKQVGEAHGFIGKRAERMGKRILVAANDNLASALKKTAA